MSHKLYTQLGSNAKRALEHRPGNDEAGDEYGESSFGGFDEYFRRKKLKLQNQDEEIRKDITDEPQLFKGMVIHINGYTKPPREDLHHLIVKHGGVYKQYLEGKTFVTHIIASNLTPKKREEYQKYKVVRPEWIVDCVKAGKTLSWNQYRLIAQSSQATLGFSQRPADSYRAVSSREEKVVYGGGGLDQSQEQQEPSHESSSYPTPPELKFMDMDIDEPEMKAEEPTTMIYEENMEMDDVDNSAQTVSDLPPEPPIKVEEAPLEHLIPSDLSSIEISSPANVEDEGHSREGRLWQKPPVRTSGQVQPLPVRSPDLSDDVQDFPIQEIQEPSITYEESPSNLPERYPTEPTPTTDPADKAAAHNAILLANPSLRQNTVINPTFLKSYFDQSRLHHLSTWKADLKTQMQLLTSSRPPRHHPKSQQKWIMHVDFDCFFCSVSLISRPELRDKPVCVGHGGGKSGEIASCNYVARKFGVHNGMFMGSALELCKDLITLPYDFPAYEKASRNFYDILLSVNADATQAVSVDEALLDVSSICNGDPESLAQSIREQVRARTQCEVSIGIGKNILLARLALRKAKPAGQYHLKDEEVMEFMTDLNVQDLPGVGWKLSEKMGDFMNIKTVGEVRTKSLSELKEKFGPKTGIKLYEFARGIDHSEVGEIVQRKSVSVEVNWGVRFETAEQVDTFLQSLATELSTRLIKESFMGSHMMLKVMRRAADAPLDPPKHLGHGKCDTFNKSVQLGVATNNAELLARETISMMKSLRIPPGELRGIGLQMGKLERTGQAKVETGQKTLQFTKSTKAESVQDSPQRKPQPPIQKSPQFMSTQFELPSQIDPQVLANLPEDIRARLVARPSISAQRTENPLSRETTPLPQEHTRQMSIKAAMKITPKKKKPSPRKTRHIDMIGQTKLPLGPADPDLDVSVLAELPTQIREEIISHSNRERALAQASEMRHLAWAAEKAVRDRKVNRTISIPEPPPKPTFQRLSELPDLRNLISTWFEELRDEGPAEEDVALLGNYLKRVVLIEKDLRKAGALVNWFLFCCKEQGPAMDDWWNAGQKLGKLVNEACSERGLGSIHFDDTRSL